MRNNVLLGLFSLLLVEPWLPPEQRLEWRVKMSSSHSNFFKFLGVYGVNVFLFHSLEPYHNHGFLSEDVEDELMREEVILSPGPSMLRLQVTSKPVDLLVAKVGVNSEV
jgi:hypothetical protein